MNDSASLVRTLRAAASQLGFQWGGVAPAIESTGFTNLVRWIDSGYAGEMSYISDRIDAYRHPKGVLEGVRAIIVLALPYSAASDGSYLHPATGRIARYAHSGIDYHDVIHPKLKQLGQILLSAVPGSHSRGVVDTAPLMEREIAQLAGFGWRGKNTLLLNKQIGSYFFLACLLTDDELPIDSPHESSHCGTCTACLDACPTDAFPAPGVLDATRCISYLTIEHREQISIELRDGIGNWLFGCDVCQEVCPWNRKPSRAAAVVANAMDNLDLGQLFDLTEEQFRQCFRQTPLWRTRRRGILRNAAIVIGNSLNREHVAALRKGLWDSEPIVRGASAWAIGKLGAINECAHLKERLKLEEDPDVRSEIQQSLDQLS